MRLRTTGRCVASLICVLWCRHEKIWCPLVYYWENILFYDVLSYTFHCFLRGFLALLFGHHVDGRYSRNREMELCLARYHGMCSDGQSSATYWGGIFREEVFQPDRPRWDLYRHSFISHVLFSFRYGNWISLCCRPMADASHLDRHSQDICLSLNPG